MREFSAVLADFVVAASALYDGQKDPRFGPHTPEQRSLVAGYEERLQEVDIALGRRLRKQGVLPSPRKEAEKE